MVGIISLLKVIWWRAINVVRPCVKKEIWNVTVYSEDTCRIDEDGGPYIVRIRDE